MGKIVATYLVKVTVRAPDEVKEGAGKAPDPPTNAELADAIQRDFTARYGFDVSATSERTDR